MSDDESREYDLAVLLEDIERVVRAEHAQKASSEIRTMFTRARINGVIRYPQPRDFHDD